MIIIKTENGDRFINDAETLQVAHLRDKAEVEVWPAKWITRKETPQYYVIRHVEAVVYTNAAQPTVRWWDEGSALKQQAKQIEDLQAQLEKRTKERDEMRDKYIEADNERTTLRDRTRPLDYRQHLLNITVMAQMNRLEEAEVNRQKKEHPNWNSYQKSGNAIRFIRIAHDHDIETVGQLLDCGSFRFAQYKGMGQKCFKELSQALETLYGIKEW